MNPLHILITGAAGQVGYSLTFRIVDGFLCPNRKIILHFWEPQFEKIKALVMEIQDCGNTPVVDIVYSQDPHIVFKDVEVAFLVGAFPRKAGMNRSDLLGKNAEIFKEQGDYLSRYANPNVKVLVIGNPANTNCLICQKFAPNLKPSNFCALTRLDHNRMRGELANKIGVPAKKIHRHYIWGNHSATQVPDATSCEVVLPNGTVKVSELLSEEYLHGELMEKIQNRGSEIIKYRGQSSAASAATAALNCMYDWLYGSPYGEIVSMAIPVPDNEPYGIKKGIVYSFPCTVDETGNYHVIENLPVSDFIMGKMKESEAELINEKKTAYEILKIQ